MQLRVLELKDMKRHDTGVSGPQGQPFCGHHNSSSEIAAQSPLNPVVTVNAMS